MARRTEQTAGILVAMVALNLWVLCSLGAKRGDWKQPTLGSTASGAAAVLRLTTLRTFGTLRFAAFGIVRTARVAVRGIAAAMRAIVRPISGALRFGIPVMKLVLPITYARWEAELRPAILAAARKAAQEEAMATFLRYSTDEQLSTDYALGGKVMWTRPISFMRGIRRFAAFVLRRPLYDDKLGAINSNVVIHPDVSPGKCWCFDASATGRIVVRLASPVVVRLVTVEHTPTRDVLHTMRAPKWLAVSVLPDGRNPFRERLFRRVGTVLFNPVRGRLQSFPVEVVDFQASAVKFDVEGNYGAERICIYRLRVHGSR